MNQSYNISKDYIQASHNFDKNVFLILNLGWVMLGLSLEEPPAGWRNLSFSKKITNLCNLSTIKFWTSLLSHQMCTFSKLLVKLKDCLSSLSLLKGYTD